MKKCFYVLLLMAAAMVMGSCGKKDVEVLNEAPEWALEENGEKVPYDTERTGILGGLYFIPIDGKVYRYDSVYQKNVDYTRDEMIFDFDEEEIDETYAHRIYTLKEYPNKTILVDVYKSKSDPWHVEEELIQYRANGAAEPGELELAKENGFVIMEDGSVAVGKEIWTEFYEKVIDGKSAEILLGYYYTLDRERTSKDYYEAVKGDYPALYLEKLAYDGEMFVVSPLHRDGDRYCVYEQPGRGIAVKRWKYLKHFTGEVNSPTALISDYDRYVLVNDENATWEKIMYGIASSQWGDYIPSHEVFCECTYK